MKKTIYLSLAAALFMASCSNDSDNNSVSNGPVAAQVTAGVNNPATRANGNQWESDEIGVMAVRVSGTPAGITSTMTSLYKNVRYATSAITADAATFTATNGSTSGTAYGIFFQDATETVTFAAYGPYQTSAANALTGNDGVISANTSAQADRAAQKAFDFIFASGATASKANPQIQFSGDKAFSHVMTRLIINVQTSTTDGFTANEVTSGTYNLSGLTHDGTFDVKTGTAQATVSGSSTAGSTPWSLNTAAIMTSEASSVSFDAILFPQTVSSLDFEAIIDGQSYKCQISPALAAGKSYTYTITAKKQGLTVDGCKVNDWTTGSTENGGAADAK